MENLRNRTYLKLVSNEKDYLKRTLKPIFISHKIPDSDLVAIRKGKVILTLNKPACIGMCILDLSKVLMYEFHYDYIKNKYDFSNYSAKSKYQDDSSKLLLGK